MTSTAKNFAGQNLRGKDFKAQDLTGADFSGSDLRGADFTNAILREVNFSQIQTGGQMHSLALQIAISLVMSALSGAIAYFAGIWLALLLSPQSITNLSIIPGLVVISLLCAEFFSILCQGFTIFALRVFSVFLSIALIVAGLASITGFLTGLVAGAFALAGALAVAIAVSGAMATSLILSIAGSIAISVIGCDFWTKDKAFIVARILTGTTTLSGALAVSGAAALAIAGSLAVAGIKAETNSSLSGLDAWTIAGFSSLAALTLGNYVSWRALNGDEKFQLILKFAIALISKGGTNFQGTDLTGANFADAFLSGSDFRNSKYRVTNFTHTSWKNSKKLDFARVRQSILVNPEVRELLVTGKPNQSKSYEGLNLRGANLDGVYLEKVNFKRAILSEASFRNANLESVNLTEAQAIGTDFTGAQMTGVCLEGCSYDHTTKLDLVDCRFVFELEHPNAKGDRERRPHDPDKDFEQGDFTKRYSETLNIVQLLIRNGINCEAFIAAWEKLTANYPDLSLDDIQEYKKKGQDVELTVSVPEDTDKGNFERNFDSGYETKLKELEAKHQAQRLEDKDRTIDTIKDMFFALAEAKKGDVTVTTTTEAKAMTDQSPVTFTARDITNSVVNLGKIKGNVTNAINQIPVKDDNDSRPDIKTLLTQLQEAISIDKELADEDKADALEQVENLAKIALHDKPEEKSTLASKALRALKRIIDTIPTITKIVETVSKVFGA
jgi:uncharacterized protein YjbI with pentapeptide repeats